MRYLSCAARAALAGLPVLRDARRAQRLRRPAPRRRGAGADRGAAPDAAPQTAAPWRIVALERTLILIKPDATRLRIAGEILSRFERRGLEIRAAKRVRVSRDLADRHYAEHREKPFFGELVDFITSGPTLALVLEGEGAIAASRMTIGAT